jgi:hypothetical protein
MTSLTRNAIAIAIVLLMMSLNVSAQRGRERPGPHTSNYDLKTVETIGGEVVRVELQEADRRPGQGVHLILKSDKGEIEVHLGPQWHLDDQGAEFKSGDRIQVKGSRVTVQGKQVMIAAEVKKGDTTLILRDEAGVPVWSGRRRGPPARTDK